MRADDWLNEIAYHHIKGDNEDNQDYHNGGKQYIRDSHQISTI